MLSFDSTLNNKSFPLMGVGQYFEKLGKLGYAKNAYKKTIDSPLATEMDKANARSAIKKVDEKMRGFEAKNEATAPVMIPTKDLTPHPNAEMEMGSQDYSRLRDDVAERGIILPLAIDTQNRIICGVHRWKAAKEVEIKECPCFVVGLTSSLDIKRYAIADNVCRRQLSPKEKKAWAVELLRLRRGTVDHIRGRKRGGPKGPTDSLSNRDIAKATGLSHTAVDRLEYKQTKGEPPLGKLAQSASSAKLAKGALIQQEDTKDSIVKGKSKIRDESFISGFFTQAKDRGNWIFGNLKKGEKLEIKVSFSYSEVE